MARNTNSWAAHLGIFPLAIVMIIVGLIALADTKGPGDTLAVFLIWSSWILMTGYVYRDANRRGMNGLLWALYAFFAHVIGFLVYMIVRTVSASPEAVVATVKCPSCQKPVHADFVICPYCRIELHTTCSECHRNLQPDWLICPYCRHEVNSKAMATVKSTEIVPAPLSNLPVVA